MASPVVLGEGAELTALTGTALAWTVWDAHPTTLNTPYKVSAQIIVAPESQTDFAVFRLPELYNLYPEIVRYMDTTFVDRPTIPLYYWDGGIRWDAEPATWDEILSPEPILKTTTRIMQMELERTAQKIEDILEFYNADLCPKQALPYHAALVGTPLPTASVEQQRAFLKKLGDTYRKKGTPLSFHRLFESLGFNLTLNETYQRKTDAAVVSGPQMGQVSTNLVQMEPIGTTSTNTSYEFQFAFTPLTRGGVVIKIYGESTVEPTLIKDDGAGGWSEGYAGTVDYTTGSATLTLPGVPTLLGQPIEADYYYFVDAYPDAQENRWTDRWRSSLVSVALEPKDDTIQLTEELNSRLLLYLELLKPAHVIVQGLEVAFSFEDDHSLTMDDNIDSVSLLHLENSFGTLYLGLGWAAESNGSLNPDPLYVGTQHRDGNEFIVRYDNAPHSGPLAGQDTTREPPPPYVYPIHLNGLFTMPYRAGVTATNTGFGTSASSGPRATLDSTTTDLTTQVELGEYIHLSGFSNSAIDGIWQVTTAPAGAGPYTAGITRVDMANAANEAAGASVTLQNHAYSRETAWIDDAALSEFEALVTADVAATTTTCSIAKGAGTSMGVGDYLIFEDGPVGGESRILTTFTDNGTYYTCAWTTALPSSLVPAVGNTTIVLPAAGIDLRNLEAGFREQDPLEIDFGEYLLDGGSPPDNVLLGPFTVTIIAAHRPLLGKTTLRFVDGGVTYEEYAFATGAFSNASGKLSASSVDYTTGVTSVTFAGGSPPDASTQVTVLSYTAVDKSLGAY